MADDFAVTSRHAGRLLSGIAALLALGFAIRTALVEAMPELHVYDGWWMVGGGALAVAIVVPLVWRWPRERALLALVIGVIIGEWAPLVVLAVRGRMSILTRLRGAMVFSSADIVGVALPVGVALAWLALREYRGRAAPTATPDR